jgi:hypothetical protein
VSKLSGASSSEAKGQEPRSLMRQERNLDDIPNIQNYPAVYKDSRRQWPFVRPPLWPFLRSSLRIALVGAMCNHMDGVMQYTACII